MESLAPYLHEKTAEPIFTPPPAPYPWRRYFARWLDMGIVSFLWQAAAAFLFHFSITRSGFLQDLIGSYIAWGFTLLLEPLFLSKWGTTPGKWLLGISIRNQHGGLLTRKEAFARTVQVFFVGEGYGIPIYNIYRYIKCYNICTEKGVLPWDENLQYQVTPFRKRYILSYLVIATTLFFLTLGIGVHQMTPPHKGVLTVAEFTENYNHLVHYYTKDRLPLLHEDGTWEDGTPIIEEADGKLLSFSIPSDIPGETKAWLSAALLANETRIYPLDITGLTGTLVELDEEPSGTAPIDNVLLYIEYFDNSAYQIDVGDVSIRQEKGLFTLTQHATLQPKN